ncbi:single-strand binding protein [Verrucomicrobium sp. GAS474]|uniref:single-stranded DNA-binding protein n=1 Tax=Verrucomicrobium sp. GAS474 TaxID=1882831 RepID=UPI00087C8ED5|nr:single-stranded DNA-binding protein [Verrucomicrobium sp. GAS474]SDU10158.1 single-strand binding protein [Verrucomicrobium sp. GAS474]
MADLNKVLLIGNLTRDPEIRYTPKGTAVGDLAIAINSTYKTQDGQTKDEVCYVDIVAWGRQAETCKEFLQKGAPILVDGRLQLDQWETKEGEKKSRLRVRAERIQFLGRPKGEGQGGGGGAPSSSGGGYRRPEGGAPSSSSSRPPASEPPHHPADDFHDSHPDDDVPF